MAGDFTTEVRPGLEALLEPPERLAGVVAAVQQGTFRGSLYALGVTDRRLILQRLDRKLAPKAQPVILGFGDLEDAGARAGVPWWSPQLIDAGAITLKLRTSDGDRLKLQLMPGGEGVLGRLGGGDSQRQGIEALAAWMREREASGGQSSR